MQYHDPSSESIAEEYPQQQLGQYTCIEQMQMLTAVSVTQLPPTARRRLLSLMEAGLTDVYRSPITGEWMVRQKLAQRQPGKTEYARKSLVQWVQEFLHAQP
jgi:hypothetical protein